MTLAESISSPPKGSELAARGEKDPECHLCASSQDLPFQTAAPSTGAALKEKRLAAGLKQREVADALGVSAALVSYVESGQINRTFVRDYLVAVEQHAELRDAE